MGNPNASSLLDTGIAEFLRLSVYGVSLVWLVGCAAPSTDSSAQSTTQTPPTARSPQATPAPVAVAVATPADASLQKASQAPSAPFEGEGWQSLFDGQTLR